MSNTHDPARESIKHSLHRRLSTFYNNAEVNIPATRDRFGYSCGEIRRRILQKISWKYHSPLMECFSLQSSTAALQVIVDSKGVRARHHITPQIVVSPATVFFNLLRSTKSTVLQIFCLLNVLFSGRRIRDTSRGFAYVENITPESFIAQSDIPTVLANFFSKGPVTILNDSSIDYVIASDKDLSHGNIYLRKNSVGFLLNHPLLKKTDIIKVLLHTIWDYFLFLKVSLQFPAFSFLYYDISFHASIRELNSKAVLRYWVQSNSNYLNQPIWLTEIPGAQKLFESTMVWYSANSIGLTYKNGPKFVELPFMQFANVDSHWVWNQEQVLWLRTLAQRSNINVAGPVMWHLPTLDRKTPSDIFRVLIFDVTPVNDHILKDAISDFAYHYYCESNMLKFIEDILLSTGPLPKNTSLAVKSKRFTKSHSQRYINELKRLTTNGTISLLSFNENIFDAVLQSDLCIVIPFTSPGYLAESLGVPVIFYDPVGIVDFSERAKYSSFRCAQDQAHLNHEVLSVYNQWECSRIKVSSQ